MKPSAWFERHLPPSHCQNGNQAWLMDWACGQGRHSLLALERGWHVLAIDRNEHALEALREAAESLQRSEHLRCLQLDLESDALPSRLSQALAELGLQAVAAIVVSNYLYRLHWKWMLASLRPGGHLLYETFARGHERFGRPTRGAFLLQPGELLARAQQSHLAVLAFEDVLERNPAGEATARIQRIVARKPELAARADPWLS